MLESALLYFAAVFSAGFALGAVRVTWLVPALGVRSAELLEMPFMLAAIIFAAHRIVRHLRVPSTIAARMAMGLPALGLMLAAECLLLPALQGFSLEEALARRDPVSGAVYYLMLVVYGVMPLLLVRYGKRQAAE